MDLFGRRPRQKRGSRCFVQLSPLLIFFVFFIVLTAVRFDGYTTEGRITSICITAAMGILYFVLLAILIRRTRRFYRLGTDSAHPVVLLHTTISRSGKDIELSFFAAEENDVRDYAVSEASEDIFSDSAALTEEQHNKLIDAYFAICEKLYKIYSYQEFIPYDLNFLHDKKILCEKQLSARLFGNSPLLPNGNTLVLYDQAQEWERLKEKWLNE